VILVRDAALADPLAAATRERLALLVHEEVALLDEERYDEWLELYTPDCAYWVPLSPGQPDPLDHVSLFHEDRTAMQLRIERLRHPRAYSLNDRIRTSRTAGTPVAERLEAVTGDLVLTRRFQMAEHHRDRTRHFAGLYTYQVTNWRDDPRIRIKRVDLVDSGAPFEAIEIFI
jgi:ethylbenzene dioxygenase subunit beta